MIDDPARPLDEGALRALVPRALASLIRRGEDFDAAEDALQEALLEALRVWPEHPPQDPRAWLTTVATRRLVDARRSEAARQRREEAEFRAEFGEWRAGAGQTPSGRTPSGPGSSGGVLGGVRLGAPLLVLIAILVMVVALALHL